MSSESCAIHNSAQSKGLLYLFIVIGRVRQMEADKGRMSVRARGFVAEEVVQINVQMLDMESGGNRIG